MNALEGTGPRREIADALKALHFTLKTGDSPVEDLI